MKELKLFNQFSLFCLLYLVVSDEGLLISHGVIPKVADKQPDIRCRVGRKDDFKIKLVNVTEGDGQIAEVKSFDRLEFQCNAKYVTRWFVSKHMEQLLVGVPVVQRIVEDIFDVTTFSFHSKLYLSVKEGFSGFVGCEAVHNSSFKSSIYIFIPEGNFFAGRDKKVEIDVTTEENRTTVSTIPCPSNYPNDERNAKLFQILTDQNGLDYPKLMKATYDPKVGFLVKEQTPLRGVFRCVAGVDEITVEFRELSALNSTIDGDVTGQIKDTDPVNEYGTPNLIWPATSGEVICENKDHRPARQLIQTISCENSYDCDLFRPCFTNPQDCPDRISQGSGCHFGACAILKESQYSGLIKCTAGINETIQYFFTGLDRRRYTLSDSIPKRALIQLNMDDVKPILYTDEPTLFFCQASSFLFDQNLQFAAIYKNNTKAPLLNGSYELATWEQLEDRESRGAIQQGIYVNLTKDMTAIVCLAPWYNSTNWLETSTEFIARDPLAPIIDKSSADRLFYRDENNRNLFCSAVGEPKPQIKWFFNGTEISSDESGEYNFGIISTDEGGSVLSFPRIQDSLAGIFSCEAHNKFGNDTFDFRVQVHERRLLNRGAIYGLSIGGAIGLLVLTLAFAYFYFRLKNELRNLTIQEIEEFVNGNPDALQINPNYGCLPAEYLPFDSKWEILDQDIEIDKGSVLGSGEFGLVVRAQLQGQPVAVKTTKANADVTYFKALLSELKVMAYIGKHTNIVDFLGAVTSRIRERVVYVVVELSPIGSLESYLKSNRGIYDHFMTVDPVAAEKTNGTSYINFEKKITTADFAKWSYQIASGMEYLANKRVIHGDLATRNVLLFAGETAKITDFGLSRQLYEHTNYIKKNEIPLPWRWMAIESLRNLEFSTKSDVWSFGITVAEIFTMAELPYAGVTWSLEFLEKLEKGLRVRKPKLATNAVYDVMLKCWHPIPQNRSSFEDLKEFFFKLLTSDITPQGSYVRIDQPAVYSDYCL